MVNLTAPLQGMQHAADRVSTAAQRIAITPAQPAGDGVDLSTEMVALMESCNAFEANAKQAGVRDQMARKTLDILA